jgi:hypothetical protein
VRAAIHIALHFLVPAAVARFGFQRHRWRAWWVMVLTLLVDLDHLLAVPVYAPDRCSIGFHPLHGPAAIGAYLLMLLFPKLRLAGLGLAIHMALDAIDCLWMRAA